MGPSTLDRVVIGIILILGTLAVWARTPSQPSSNPFSSTTQEPQPVTSDRLQVSRLDIALDAKGPRLAFSIVEGRTIFGFFKSPKSMKAGFTVGSKGAAGFEVFDNNLRSRAAWSISSEGPVILLRDDRPSLRLLIGVDLPNRAGIKLLDQNEEGRAFLGLTSDLHPSLLFAGPRESVRLKCELTERSPIISLFDESGRPIWRAP